MVKINWTNLAVEDLKSVFDYISRDSFRYAKIQISRLNSRTQILKTLPNAGKVVPEFENEKLRELIEGNYRIIYKVVNTSKIDILTIHNSAKDLTERSIE